MPILLHESSHVTHYLSAGCEGLTTQNQKHKEELIDFYSLIGIKLKTHKATTKTNSINEHCVKVALNLKPYFPAVDESS